TATMLLITVNSQGAMPSVVILKNVSTGVLAAIWPKSCSVFANWITGNLLAFASLSAATATLDSLIFFEASSLHDVNATTHKALNPKIILLIIYWFSL